MKHLTQQFTVHPVGQGLFYSGHVAISNAGELPATFNFVFDCGSLNAANVDEEVKLYQTKYLPEGTYLDLLVISHFDEDHVNHIKILLDKRKVKKVVLPFAPLEERLYLVLKYYSQFKKGNTPGDDFFIQFTLDPIGTLGPYLSGDGTIYIVTSGPDEPFPDPEKDSGNESGASESGSGNFEFDIPGADELTSDDNLFPVAEASNRIKKFDDSKKGLLFLHRGRVTPIMEFLFYRKKISGDDSKFFEAAYKAFCIQYGLDEQDKSQSGIDALMEKIKGIDSAGPVRDLYSKVKAANPQFKVPGKVVNDLNTTALCMMHYNLRSIYTLGHPEHYWIEKDITVIKKFDGTNRTRMEHPEHRFYPSRYHWHPDHPPVRFPNCLLTSDSFLKTKKEVQAFWVKYQYYWEQFWLFQVPHHGSEYNAGAELLNRLPPAIRLAKFINHSARKISSWQHPSPQLINDLVAAGQSVNVFPVNEFTGLRFEVIGRL